MLVERSFLQCLAVFSIMLGATNAIATDNCTADGSSKKLCENALLVLTQKVGWPTNRPRTLDDIRIRHPYNFDQATMISFDTDDPGTVGEAICDTSKLEVADQPGKDTFFVCFFVRIFERDPTGTNGFGRQVGNYGEQIAPRPHH